jgi:hypothetical protein
MFILKPCLLGQIVPDGVLDCENSNMMLGWIDGHTVSIVHRWAEGKTDRNAEFAAEFVALNVRLRRRPPASARSPPAAQSPLDRAA